MQNHTNQNRQCAYLFGLMIFIGSLPPAGATDITKPDATNLTPTPQGEFAKGLAESQGSPPNNTPADASAAGIRQVGIGGSTTLPSSLDLPKPDVPNPEKEALLKELGELNPAQMLSQLVDLQLRLTKLEASRNTVQAPFKVVDAAGKTLLSVTQENNVLSLTLGEPGKAMTRLLVDGDAARVVAISKGNASMMNADANHSRATFTSNAVRTTVGATEEGVTGLLVSKAEGDQAMGELALRTGKKFALRLYSEAGHVIAAGGENPTTAGTGLLYIGNGQKNLAALAADDQGGGLVHAFAPDGSVGSGLVGAERLVAAYNPSGTAIASMGKSDKSDGGNITTRDPSGDGVFSAGYNSAVGGGDACVYRAKRQNTFCLGIGLPGMMGTMGN